MGKPLIYPNPFVDEVSISRNFPEDFTLVITDLEGKMHFLHTYPGNQGKVMLEQLQAGTYIFKIISNGKSFEEKMIKIQNHK